MDNAQQKKILVVEDDEAIRVALTGELTRNGFNVQSAVDGEEGLRHAMEFRPDLILLDLGLPKMDGFKVLDRLRADPWGSGVPIIILSNSSDEEKVMQAMQRATFDYLVKADWKLEDIMKKVKAKLGY